MSKRIVLVALLACAVTGVAITRNAASGPRLADLTAPDVPQLLGYTMSQLAGVPQSAGEAFDFAVPLGGQQYTVSLEPYSVRTDDFQLLVDNGDGQLVPVEAQPPSTYRGAVVGVPGSWATASVIGGRLNANVVIEGAYWSIEPLEALAGDAPVAAGSYAIYREEDVMPADKGCGGGIPNPVAQAGGEPAGAGGGVAGGTGLEIVEIGCDADVEYWIKNGSNVDNTMVDIENVINSVSAIYESQLSLTFEVTTIVVRTGATNSDPYSSSICSTLLNQFRNAWSSAPENSIRRDVAHLFTGRNLADCLGIAWLASICNGASGFGYGVVESRAPGLPFTARVATSAHEIGHNFNAPHCCGSCSGCSGCRIMCPCIGGCSGLITSFGTASLNSMSPYIAGLFCLQDEPVPLSPPFFDNFPTTTINADKWRYNNGAIFNSAATNEPSPTLSMNLDAFGAGEYQFNEVRTNLIDLSGLEGTGYFVQFYTQAVGVDAGEKLLVDYWTGKDGTQQWRNLATIASDGTTETVFTEHTIPLDGLSPSPFNSDFRLRFISDVDSAGDDWYIDDVFISGVAPPSNDSCLTPIAVGEGSFPFTTVGASTDGLPEFCSGGVGGVSFTDDTWFLYTPTCTDNVTFSACNAANFDTRIAVYIDSGSCPPNSALACSDDAAGCGVTSQVTLLVTPLLTYYVRVGATSGGGTGTLTISCPAQDCPWDCADGGDGLVGINDFLALLAAWGTVGGPCDFDGGGVGINGFLDLLANWGACP